MVEPRFLLLLGLVNVEFCIKVNVFSDHGKTGNKVSILFIKSIVVVLRSLDGILANFSVLLGEAGGIFEFTGSLW